MNYLKNYACEGKLTAVNQRPFDRDYYSLCTDVPPSQKKIGRRNVSSPDFFSEGGKTSVHRLRLLMKKKSHVKHVKISYSASYLTVQASYITFLFTGNESLGPVRVS